MIINSVTSRTDPYKPVIPHMLIITLGTNVMPLAFGILYNYANLLFYIRDVVLF